MQGALSGRLSGNVHPRQVTGTLISALTDLDTGVAAEAAATLTRSASAPDGVLPSQPTYLFISTWHVRQSQQLAARELKCCAGYELLVGEGARQHLQQVLASSDPSIRMRGLSLLASLASVAQDNVRALHESGTKSLQNYYPLMILHVQSLIACRHGCWSLQRSFREAA